MQVGGVERCGGSCQTERKRRNKNVIVRTKTKDKTRQDAVQLQIAAVMADTAHGNGWPTAVFCECCSDHAVAVGGSPKPSPAQAS